MTEGVVSSVGAVEGTLVADSVGFVSPAVVTLGEVVTGVVLGSSVSFVSAGDVDFTVVEVSAPIELLASMASVVILGVVTSVVFIVDGCVTSIPNGVDSLVSAVTAGVVGFVSFVGGIVVESFVSGVSADVVSSGGTSEDGVVPPISSDDFVDGTVDSSDTIVCWLASVSLLTNGVVTTSVVSAASVVSGLEGVVISGP